MPIPGDTIEYYPDTAGINGIERIVAPRAHVHGRLYLGPSVPGQGIVENVYDRRNLWGYVWNSGGNRNDEVYQFGLFTVGGVRVEF